MKKNILVVTGACLFIGIMGAAQATGDITAGQTKSTKCAACHGENGLGKAKNPPLAGKEAEFLAKQLQDFKSGSRKSPMMNMMAKPLSDQDIADLTVYYASLNGK